MLPLTASLAQRALVRLDFMKYWLIKSEPDVFSFEDLLANPDQTEAWDGVRNYQARNFMRDDMTIGDQILYYHSNTRPPAVVGIAEVASEPYPDPSQFDPKSDYFDAKAGEDNVRWVLVDVKAVRKLERPVTLDEMKAEPKLADMRLVQKGNRLSVMPVAKKEFEKVVNMAKE